MITKKENSEIMCINLIHNEEAPELYLENETHTEFEVWYIDDAEIGEEFIVFSDLDYDENEIFFAARFIQLAADRLMIEQIDDEEKKQLESAIRQKKHMEMAIQNYFEYYPIATPRNVQLSQAASISVGSFSVMSKVKLHNTAILNQYHDGITADVFTKRHLYSLRCEVNYKDRFIELCIRLPIECRPDSRTLIIDYLQEVNDTIAEQAELFLGEYGEISICIRIPYLDSVVTVERLDKELQHLLILADALFENIREIGG